ncbi:MAG TPA: flavin reductase family protein [Nocardioidaceae bacterium]|nr:flavin reductase family protein [Nocardioidaceae bacterium]
MPYDALPLTDPDTAADASAVASPSTLRELMREVAQPVVVVSGTAGNGDPRPVAMTVSSVTSVSLDPPLVLFCPSRHSRTWASLAPTGRFILNVLTDRQRDLAAWFGGRLLHALPPDRGDRPPAGSVRWTCVGELPALAGSAAAASCRIVAVHPGGDHDIVLAAVDQIVLATGRNGPLSYWRGGYATVRTVGRDPSC